MVEVVGMIARFGISAVPGFQGSRVPWFKQCGGIDITYTLWNIQPMSSALGEFEQLVLLAVLRLGPDAYGATIRREIETRADRELSISAVYTTLQRLEQKGLVRTRMGDPLPERGGRRRKYVELLPAGARALKVAYNAFAGMTAGVEQRLKAL